MILEIRLKSGNVVEDNNVITGETELSLENEYHVVVPVHIDGILYWNAVLEEDGDKEFIVICLMNANLPIDMTMKEFNEYFLKKLTEHTNGNLPLSEKGKDWFRYLKENHGNNFVERNSEESF